MLGGVAILGAAGLAATAAFPYLAVHHPLGLVALSPLIRHIVLVAPDCDPTALLALGVTRRVLALTLTYGLGASYGPSMIEKILKRAPKLRRVILVLEKLVARFGAPALFVLPTFTMAALAGIARTHRLGALTAVSMGQALWVTMAIYFSDVVAPITEAVMGFLVTHTVPATIVCIVLVALQQLYARRRR